MEVFLYCTKKQVSFVDSSRYYVSPVTKWHYVEWTNWILIGVSSSINGLCSINWYFTGFDIKKRFSAIASFLSACAFLWENFAQWWQLILRLSGLDWDRSINMLNACSIYSQSYLGDLIYSSLFIRILMFLTIKFLTSARTTYDGWLGADCVAQELCQMNDIIITSANLGIFTVGKQVCRCEC